MSQAEKEEERELKKRMLEFKENVVAKAAAKAYNIIHEQLPKKVVRLYDLFENERIFHLTVSEMDEEILKYIPDFSSIHSTSPQAEAKQEAQQSSGSDSKKRKYDDISKDQIPATIPCNPALVKVAHTIKQETLETVEMLNTVKTWIQLNIPRIEDGNNFGVGIIEEVVTEIGKAEEVGFTVLESITKYYINRAKLITKLRKHAEIADYRQSLIELDEREFINLKLCSQDLKNAVALTYDMITKNYDKLKAPRTSNHLASMI